MKKAYLTVVFIAGLSLTAQLYPAQARRSALNDVQFDGVTSDRGLKTAGITREKWLEIYPRQAREYWDAWDCEGKSCDSQWKANIRAKARLVPRPKEKSASKPVKPKP